MILAMAQQILTTNGHQVIGLPSGDDLGINLVTLMPDIVILDYFLPRITGRELFKMIRSDARGQGMAVIFLTAKPASELRELSQEPRVTVLTKPLDPIRLVQAVNRALGFA